MSLDLFTSSCHAYWLTFVAIKCALIQRHTYSSLKGAILLVRDEYMSSAYMPIFQDVFFASFSFSLTWFYLDATHL